MAAGDFSEVGDLASGESATSDNEEVPGLCLAFLEGEGLSTGPGVPVPRPSLVFRGSSAASQLYRAEVKDSEWHLRRMQMM